MGKPLAYLYQISNAYEKKFPSFAPKSYMILACFCFSFMALCIRLLKRLSAPEILFYRSILSICMMYAIINASKANAYPHGSVLKKLIMRGFFGSVSVMFQYQVSKMIPLSEGVVLQRCSPIWMAIANAYIFRTEKPSLNLFGTIILGILGINFIAMPPQFASFLKYLGFDVSMRVSQIPDYDVYHMIGVLMALSVGFLQTSVQILMAELSKEANQFVVIMYFSFVTLTFPCIFNLQFIPYVTPNFEEILILTVVGISGTIGQVFVNRAFFFGNTSIISLLGQSQVLFNLLIDVFILNETLGLTTYFGMVLLLIALMIAIIYYGKKKK